MTLGHHHSRHVGLSEQARAVTVVTLHVASGSAGSFLT